MHAHADPGPAARDRAFERLYRRYVTDVYRYTLALLRNPADAEDVTQTTFLNAYRAYRRGEEPLKPQNWLIKIAHNACRTRYLRASRRPVEVPLEHSLRELAVPEADIPDVKAVLDALARLPFNQRAALVMRELEGRSYTEIAHALDVTVPAVEALIFRARRALRVRRSALRSLATLPMPASLTSFSGGGAAMGGSALVGTGVVLKAVLALGVGVVAGTAGMAVEAKVLTPNGVEAAHASAPTVAGGSVSSTLGSGRPVSSVGTIRARKLILGVGVELALDPSTAAELPQGGPGKLPGSAFGSPPLTAGPAPSSAPTGSGLAQTPASSATETVGAAVPAPPVGVPAVPVPAVPVPAVPVPAVPVPAVPVPAVPVPAVPLPPVPPPALPDPPELPLPVEVPPPPLPPPPSLP